MLPSAPETLGYKESSDIDYDNYDTKRYLFPMSVCSRMDFTCFCLAQLLMSSLIMTITAERGVPDGREGRVFRIRQECNVLVGPTFEVLAKCKIRVSQLVTSST